MKKFKVYFWKGLPRKLFKEIKEKYKDRKKDYMNIYVCDSFEEMYRLANKLEKCYLDEDYGARTMCYTKKFYEFATGKYIKTSPCRGYIVFNKDYFYMDAITHESTHAVIGYFSRQLKDESQEVFTEVDDMGNILSDNLEIEELFCYMVGNLSDQIVGGYNGK